MYLLVGGIDQIVPKSGAAQVMVTYNVGCLDLAVVSKKIWNTVTPS